MKGLAALVHGDIEPVFRNIDPNVSHPILLCRSCTPTCGNPNLRIPATIRAIDPRNEPVTPLSFDLDDPYQIGLLVRCTLCHYYIVVIQVPKESAPRIRAANFAVPCAP